jgi:predicted RND superfamily exporter protein
MKIGDQMKNCKWIIFLLLLLLSAFIIFRYIQKRPFYEAEKMIPQEIEVIEKEIEVTEPEITSTQE